MFKLVGCLGLIVSMGLLAGCDWGGSGGDSTWSDSYSWANFAGVYRPLPGRTYLAQVPTVPTNTTSSTVQTTQSLGTSDGISSAHFDGTLANLPISIGSVIVQSGNGATYSVADGDGDGQLEGKGGSGSINYATGVININWIQAPPAGENTIVTYRYSSASTPGNPQAPGGQEIFTMTLQQTGNILDAVDSRGMTYHGEISSLAQSGGDKTGNTSGSVTANFTMKAADGSKIVGVLTGLYTAPDQGGASETTVGGSPSNGGTSGARIGKAQQLNTDNSGDTVVTTGNLLNRQMQGTYINPDGSSGDIQGQAGSISVTVTN